MNYYTLLCTTLCLMLQMPFTAYGNTIPFIGTIQFPKAVQSIPTLCGYYKGTRFSITSDTSRSTSTAHFEIQEEKECNQLGILFTTQVKPVGHGKKIHGLAVPKGIGYTYYHVWRAQGDYAWRFNHWITQVKTLASDRMIPENCIIILLNPEFVQTVEKGSWSQQSNVVQLPTVVIKSADDINTTIHKAAATLSLAAMDLNAIHAPVKTARQLNGLTVALVKK